MTDRTAAINPGEHLTEERLVMHYFGDDPAPEQAARHIAECAACRAEYESIKQTMLVVDALEVPVRDERYAAEVWSSVRKSLNLRPKSRWVGWFAWPRLAIIAATACLIVVAFVAGRRFPDREQPQVAAQFDEQMRNRLLIVTLGDHLEQSQRMLTEVSNSDVTELPIERESAQQLVAANRLYRQTVSEAGDQAMTAMLEMLELYLVEASHARPEDLKELQKRMTEEDILFQLRVVNSQIKQKQRKMVPIQSH